MNENLEDLKQKAEQLLRDKNWDELIPVCTKITELEQRPDAKASAFNNRGAAYDKKGDSDRAIADFDTAIELDPKHAEIYSNRGTVYYNKDDHDRAIADFDAAIELDPKHVDAYNNRGAAYDKKDDSGRAIADFDAAIELDPTNVDAYNNRGAAYDKKGDSGRAIADFDTAIELDPTNVGAYNNRGVAYLIKDDYDNAIMDFLDANRCDSNLRLGQPIVYIASQIENARISREDMGEAFKCFVRLFSAIKDIQHSLCYKPESAKEVAHYTSLHTLKALAKKKRFRLYNATYMNDPEEGHVFFDVMKKSGIDLKEVFYGDQDPPYPSPAYIGSFVRVDSSKQKDELFLWRTYGKHDQEEGAGACLIFSHSDDDNCFAEEPPIQISAMSQLRMNKGQSSQIQQQTKPALYKIAYKRDCKEEGLPEKLKELATSLEEIKKFKSQTDKSNQEGLAKLVRELLDDIRFLFKADYYKEEQEVRVVEMRYSWKDGTQALDQIQVDTEQIPPRFYLETSKDFRFSEVILGPKARGVPEWKRWLKEQDKTLSVKRSGIKYGKPYL